MDYLCRYGLFVGVVVAVFGCAPAVTSTPVETSELEEVAPLNPAAGMEVATEKQEPTPLELLAKASIHLERGLKALEVDNAVEAQGAFIEAIALKEDFLPGHYNLAKVLVDEGLLERAEKEYRRVLEIDPGFGPGVAGLGGILEARGDRDGAARLFRSALKSNEENTSARAALAQLLVRSGKLEEAREEALLVLRIDERNAQAILALGMVYRRQGKFELAEMALRQALDVDRRLGTAFNELGIALNTQGKKAQAVQAFELAVQANPGSASVYNNLGVLRTDVGAYRLATEALERATELEGERPEYLVNLANAYRGDQRYVEAEATYLKALRLREDLGSAIFNLGILYLDNELPGKENPLVRYRLTIDYLNKYSQLGFVDEEDTEVLEQYIAQAQKSIDKENKAIERRRKREARKRKRREREEAKKREQEAGE